MADARQGTKPHQPLDSQTNSVQAILLRESFDVADGATSAALTDCWLIRVVALTTGVRINIQPTPAVEADSTYLPLNSVEYFAVLPGDKIGVIDGDINVTKC